MANKKGRTKESKTKATSKLRSASPSSRYGLSETDLDQMGESTDSSGPRSATSSPAESEKGSEGAIVSADVDSSPIGEDYLKLENAGRSALEGTKFGKDFGIRSHREMFQKIEDTFRFCAECKKLPQDLMDPAALRRCKRCQNVYYCGVSCQKVNWPTHKAFCKKLQLAAIDRLVEWLVFRGVLPFTTCAWTRQPHELTGWGDWFSMQENLEYELDKVLESDHMRILWSNAGKPRPEDPDLKESVKRVTSEFLSRPLTIGFGLKTFGLNPLKQPLTIHVVGASHTETLNARVTDMDELARMFSGNQGLEVVMVGPEVIRGDISRPPLKALGPKGRVYLSAYKELYHIFWESMVETREAARPDLVVGFHPGPCHRGLTLCPHSDLELKYSLQILAELECHIITSGANPWCSLKPEQVQSCPNKLPVYCNGYYAAFLGAVEEPREGEDVEEEEEQLSHRPL
ncbi:MSS51 protein, partial [Polypterus senegalus]